MTDFGKVEAALKERGYTVHTFADAEAAGAYLNGEIDGKTVGIGGSGTVQASGAFELLSTHNTVHWHWKQDPDTARKASMNADVYLTSANALAETGELVSIDGAGNRLSSMLFGHKKVYYLIGRNKLVPTWEDAVDRARNIAAPHRAQQMGKKTPCAAKADRCYDCKSPERICRGMLTLWGPMMGQEAEILLIDQDLGL